MHSPALLATASQTYTAAVVPSFLVERAAYKYTIPEWSNLPLLQVRMQNLLVCSGSGLEALLLVLLARVKENCMYADLIDHDSSTNTWYQGRPEL